MAARSRTVIQSNTHNDEPTTLFFRCKALGQQATGPNQTAVNIIQQLEPQAKLYYPNGVWEENIRLKLMLFLQYPSEKLANERLEPQMSNPEQ